MKLESGIMESELIQWLDEKTITPDNIDDIQRRCLMPWGSEWNALVRAETAKREKPTNSRQRRKKMASDRHRPPATKN